MTEVLLRFVLGLNLFSVLINGLYNLTENSLIEFADKKRCTLKVRVKLLMILRNWRT